VSNRQLWRGQGSCNETEYAFELGNPLRFADEAPLTGTLHSNDVGVSISLNGISSLNDMSGELYVYANLMIWWQDCRYAQALEKAWSSVCSSANSTNANCAYLKEDFVVDGLKNLWGQYGGWPARYTKLRQTLLELDPVLFGFTPNEFWVPVPEELLPPSWGNSRSVVQRGSWLVSDGFRGDAVYGWQAGVFYAGIWDTDTVKLSLKEDTSRYPFDKRKFQLCLPFGFWTKPSLTVLDEAVNSEFSQFQPHVLSDVSPYLGQKLVDDLTNLGLSIASVETDSLGLDVASAEVLQCISITLTRNPGIIVQRLFMPLFAVLAVMCVGFWLPINLTMPRVASFSLSFVSINAFRTGAYNIKSTPPSFMLQWLDVLFLCSYEVTIIGVLSNVAAQYLWQFTSHIAGEFVDRVMRRLLPALCVVLIGFMFVEAFVEDADITVAVAVSQCMVAVTVFGLVLAIVVYLRLLPEILIRTVVRDMTDHTLRWRDGVQFDSRELGYIFRQIDADKNGHVTPEEIFAALEKHGMRFESQDMRTEFRDNFYRACSQVGGGEDFSGKFTFAQFKKELKDIFNHKLVVLDGCVTIAQNDARWLRNSALRRISRSFNDIEE
jgi:hypothetical protein